MSAFYFFATASDLASVLGDLESAHRLVFFKTGKFETDHLLQYESGLSIPNFGKADSPSAASSTSYLVFESPQKPTVRNLVTVHGTRYFVDQLANSDSVVFAPSGIWDACLIRGSVGTASNTRRSRQLMRWFRSAFAQHMQKLRNHYVGPEAFTFLMEGSHRLTASADGAPEYDLSP
jgi:hypothetical protein